MSHFVNISSDFIELCQTLVPTPATCASFCPVDFFSPCASGRSIPTRLPGLEYPSYAAHANAPAVLADSWGVELVGRSDGCETFSLGSEALFPNESVADGAERQSSVLDNPYGSTKISGLLCSSRAALPSTWL